MINANELRIGNNVQFNDNCDRDGKIIALHGHWVEMSCDYIPDHQELPVKEISMDYEYIIPIHLSPDILEACGFENVQGDFWMKAGELMLALDNVWWWTNSWEADGEFGFDTLAPYKEISSLHQLQNLFFALTGQEINYKPKN